MKEEYNYYLYSPCGNDTALVEDVRISSNERKIINDLIMNKHNNIEQVGFVDKKEYLLTMAGGEFCANAVRCAVKYYLKDKKGKIKIRVSGGYVVEAGIDNEGNVWAQMPIKKNYKPVRKLDEGVYEVTLKGIKHIVVDVKISKKYISSSKKIKETAVKFIKKYNIKEKKAVGVVFLEKKDAELRIHPVVWVKRIDTLFYETACGSGTTAVALLEAFKSRKSTTVRLIQPSGECIVSKVELVHGKVNNAVIYGKVKTDNNLRKIKTHPSC